MPKKRQACSVCNGKSKDCPVCVPYVNATPQPAPSLSLGADPLEMTVREFLAALTERASPANDGDWINIRGDVYPWKRIVASAERGECQVSRVGRRLMMQRTELDRWLAVRRIGPKNGPKKIKPAEPAKSKGEFGDSVQRALKRNGLA